MAKTKATWPLFSHWHFSRSLRRILHSRTSQKFNPKPRHDASFDYGHTIDFAAV